MRSEIDDYVIDTLMPDLIGHDRRPSAFLVYLFFYVEAARRKSKMVSKSHSEIADAVGISRRAVQDAVKCLVRRQLLSVQASGTNDASRYEVKTPWKK